MLSICLSSTYRPNGQNSNTTEMFQTKHTQQWQPARKKKFNSTMITLCVYVRFVLLVFPTSFGAFDATQRFVFFRSFFPDSFCWCLIRWVEICVVSHSKCFVLSFACSDIVPWHPPIRRFVGVTHTKTLTTNHSGNSEIPENRFFTLSYTHTLARRSIRTFSRCVYNVCLWNRTRWTTDSVWLFEFWWFYFRPFLSSVQPMNFSTFCSNFLF